MHTSGVLAVNGNKAVAISLALDGGQFTVVKK